MKVLFLKTLVTKLLTSVANSANVPGRLADRQRGHPAGVTRQRPDVRKGVNVPDGCRAVLGGGHEEAEGVANGDAGDLRGVAVQ